MKIMSRKEGKNRNPPPQAGVPISSLSLPNTSPARQSLGSKKKSDTKNVHPGYNMFDWHKVCNSGQDMTGTGGKLLKVTREELARHCKDDDVWTAVRGVVYNITLFAKYHPGGKPQLMRGAGNDCTELFDKVHVWVNSEAILEKCVVGYLVGAKPPQKQTNLAVGVVKPPFPGESSGSGNQSSLGEDVLSLDVPSLGGVANGGNMEEEETQDGTITQQPGDPPLLDQTDNISISIPTATTGISIPVPTVAMEIPVPSNISISSPSADIPTPGISIPVPNLTTGISIPVPTGNSSILASTSDDIPTAGISIPVPTSNISISAPSTAGISIPVPTNNISSFANSSSFSDSQTANSALYKPIPFLPARLQYITDHPLISKTAYETAV